MPRMLCIAVGLLTLVGCGQEPSGEPSHFELGKPAPPLGVEKLVQPTEGATATWKALRGKVVVLEFWATWCGPCVSAIAHLNQLADAFKDRPVQFIAITDEKEDLVRRFLGRKAMRAWVALDTDRSMFRDYGVVGIPRTILVDARGVVVGDTHPTMLSAAVLESVLAGRPTGLPERPNDLETVSAPESGDQENAAPLAEISVRRRDDSEGSMWSTDSRGWEFSGCALQTIIEAAYDARPYQVLLPDDLSDARFYVKAKVAGGREAARSLLQATLTSALGLTLRREPRELEAYRLLVPPDGTHKLTPTVMEPHAGAHGGSGTDAAGMMNYTLSNQTVAALCETLGSLLGCPVLDETRLEGRFDVLLVWKYGEREELRKAVREQLGLELQPTKHTVEMLIFDARPNGQALAPP